MLSKSFRIIAVTVIVLGLIIFLAQCFATYYVNRQLPEILRQRVEKASKGRYTLQCGSLNLSLFKASVSVSHMLILPLRLSKGEASYVLKTGPLHIEHIDLPAFFKDNQIKAAKVNLTKGLLYIVQPGRQLAGIKEEEALNEAKKIGDVELDEVNCEQAELKILSKGKVILETQQTRFSIAKFAINALSDSIGQPFTYTDLQLHSKGFIFRSLDSLYTVSGKNLHAALPRSELSIDSLRLFPNYSKRAFGQAAGKQSSRLELTCSRLSFKGMNVFAFAEQGYFISRYLLLNGLKIGVHLNKKVKFVEERKASLQQLIRSAPFRLRIDTIITRRAGVVYEHLAPDGTRPGRITFNDLSAELTGLTNDASEMKRGVLRFRGRCLFMNAALLKAEYDFPLRAESEHFFCRGSLRRLKLERLNEMIGQITPLRIKSGVLDSLRFSFEAGPSRSSGKLVLCYHDFRLQLKEENSSLLKRLAGRMLLSSLRSDNPNRKGSLKEAEIAYTRYPYKSFFYYTWKSLQSGIMETMGIRSETLLHRSDPR